MELLEKLAAMKKKLAEIESKTEKNSQELNSQLKGIKGELSIIEDMNSRLDKVSTQSSKEIENFNNRIDTIEENIKKNLSNFTSNIKSTTDNYEKEVSGLKSEFKKIKSQLEEISKKSSDVVDKKYKKIIDLSASVGEIQKNIGKTEKKVQKILMETPTDDDLKDLREDLSKIKKEIGDKVSEKEVESIKKATEGIDEIISDSLADIRKEFDEIKTKMAGLVELRNLHKHFAELKMDVTSTEAGLSRKMDEIQQEVGLVKQEMEKYPEFEELAGQDKALRASVEKLESKFDVDFEKVLGEFQSLGTIFAKKDDVEMNAAEIKSILAKTEAMMKDLDNRHTALEKQIVVREDAKDKRIADQVNESLSQIQHMFNEFQDQRETAHRIESEFKILREQIITTQNALMELNNFIQQQTRPDY